MGSPTDRPACPSSEAITVQPRETCDKMEGRCPLWVRTGSLTLRCFLVYIFDLFKPVPSLTA